eukprot:23079-Pyramimonas_sp.AAC.1
MMWVRTESDLVRFKIRTSDVQRVSTVRRRNACSRQGWSELDTPLKTAQCLLGRSNETDVKLTLRGRATLFLAGRRPVPTSSCFSLLYLLRLLLLLLLLQPSS